MDTSALVLGLRVALSLACVLVLMWFIARRLSGTAAVKRQRTANLSVVARQSLGGRTGVALVEVGGRRLLVGVSEHGVNLLTEVEPEPAAAEARAERAERVELDPAELAGTLSDADLAELAGMPGLLVPVDGPDADESPASQISPTPLTSPLTPAARMPAVPQQRSPLEGSILDATTWRQAMVAVQERTIRR